MNVACWMPAVCFSLVFSFSLPHYSPPFLTSSFFLSLSFFLSIQIIHENIFITYGSKNSAFALHASLLILCTLSDTHSRKQWSGWHIQSNKVPFSLPFSLPKVTIIVKFFFLVSLAEILFYGELEWFNFLFGPRFGSAECS